MDKYAKPGEEYNIVCTTYRLTEHYHYWTKNNPDERAAHAGAVRRNSGRTGRPNGNSRRRKGQSHQRARHYIAKALVTAA
jgi:hypothetical protein